MRTDPWGLVDINMIPHDQEWLRNEVEKLPASPKTITVAGHADSQMIDDENGKPVRPWQLAERIKKLPKYSKNKPVILYSCEAGRGEGCYASKLAKCLGGNPVLAAEESVWPEGGRPVIAPARKDDDNEPDLSKRRKFRVF